jgi:hypothetical protein
MMQAKPLISRFVVFSAMLAAACPVIAVAGTDTIAKHELRFDWLENSQIKTSSDNDSKVVIEDGRNATTGGTAAGTYGFNGILTRSTIESTPGDPLKLKALSSHSFDVDGINRSNTWFGVSSQTENKVFHSEQLQMTNAPAGNEFRATFFWHITGQFGLEVSKNANQDPLYNASATMEFAYESSAPLYPSRKPAIDTLTFDFDAPGGALTGGDQVFTGEVDEMVQIDVITNGVLTLAHTVELTSSTFFLNDGPSLNFDLEGIALHDFSSTAELTGVLFRDLDGNVLTDVGVFSPEGFYYPVLDAVPAAVPVPPALALFISGAACLLLLGNNRNHSGRLSRHAAMAVPMRKPASV